MGTRALLALQFLLHIVTGDYQCLCNYGNNVPVFEQESLESQTVGFLQKFDCKPTLPSSDLDSGVAAISFFQTIGYVHLNNATQVQTCAGNPPPVVGIGPSVTVEAHSIPVEIATTIAATAPIVTFTSAPTPAPMPEGHTQLCPSHMLNDARINNGFIGQYGNYCYELVNSPNAWENAERHCRATSASGHLLHILTQGEQDYVTRFLSSHNYIQSVWTGLNDRRLEGVFEWSSGHPVTYIHTGVQFSVNAHHSQDDCFLFLQGGDWSDLPCGSSFFLGLGFGEQHPFICQYEVSSRPPDIFSALANVILG